jgi:NADPH-dependent curcumin reductase CurA
MKTAIPTPAAGLSLDPYMRGRMNDGKPYAKPRIVEPLAHVGRAGRASVVLIDFSNDRTGV